MDKEVDEEGINFQCDTLIEGGEADWTPMARAHREALEMLGKILASSTKSTAADVLNIKNIIRMISGEAEDVKLQLGNLHHLIGQHGSLADAVQAALSSHAVVQDDLPDLREDINKFSTELNKFAGAAKVSSETVLTIIARIRDKAKSRHVEVKNRMSQLEGALRETYRPPSPPMALRTSLLCGDNILGIDGDTPLGVASVGGSKMVIMANYLFGLIWDLQAKVDVLTERSKNTGVIFKQIAFSYEAEFTYWYTSLNPSGSGLAAFVDLVSIWTFGSNEQVDTSQWLNEIHRSRSVGLKGGNSDAVYAHSMSQRYPTCFVGKDKNLILSTMTIKMLESYDAWRGTIMGDGQKERLTNDLQMAVHRHCQYCDDFVSEGILREMAIKTAEFMLIFCNALVAYIEEEYTLLLSFKLLPKHLLLLLSNQIVQICDDLFEFRNKAASVDLQSPLSAGIRFAWVTLQALGSMEGYLRDKFRLHQAINSTFIRFLTRHMADQTLVGLKGSVDGFEKKITDLSSKVTTLTTVCSNKVTQEMFNRLESKMDRIVTDNNLKKPAGARA